MPDVTDGQAGVAGEVALIEKGDRTKATRRASKPVFVDITGRRRRLLAVVGGAGGVVLLLVVLTLLAGFTGVGPGRLPGWPGSDGGRVQGVGPTPAPSGTQPRPAAGNPTPAGASAVRPSSGPGPTLPPPTTPAPTPTADPTPSGNPRPTHGPTGHPSKKP